MDQSLRKLTLVYPRESEATLVELLLEFEPGAPGFTSWHVDGHGHDFASAGPAERVRGRTRRGTLVTVMPEENIAALLDVILQKAPIPHLTYWTEPILSFGRTGS